MGHWLFFFETRQARENSMNKITVGLVGAQCMSLNHIITENLLTICRLFLKNSRHLPGGRDEVIGIFQLCFFLRFSFLSFKQIPF